jgi:hypothetical protein
MNCSYSDIDIKYDKQQKINTKIQINMVSKLTFIFGSCGAGINLTQYLFAQFKVESAQTKI